MTSVNEFADLVLQAAIGYAQRGWRVHPLRPGTKVPVLPRWQEEATTDVEKIATWWSGEYRGFNVGIATGKASNLWVLDIDTGHGPDAAVSLKKLEDSHKPLKRTYTATTPSGGSHLYYAWPDEVPDADGHLPSWQNSAGTVLGPGLDVRAEGGQVAAWPSRLRTGGRYKRASKIDPVRVPKWLAKMTEAHDADEVAHTFRLEDLNPAAQSTATRYATRAIQGEIERLQELKQRRTQNGVGYSGKPWDHTTFSVACRLLELGNAEWAPITPEDAFSLLMQHAPTDKGFGPDRVQAKWESARRTVGDRQAKLPGTVIGPYVLPGAGPKGGVGQPAAEEFFDKAIGLKADAVARWVNRADLAIGVDNFLWSYDTGVWRPDRNVVLSRGSSLLGDRWRHSYAATIEDLVRASPSTQRLHNTVHTDFVNLRNGMLDWASGTLEPHDASYLSTTQLPVEWEPAATCPRFDAWANQVVPAGVLPRLWEAIGYMLLPGNELQKAILLYGPGGNGKGTLIRVLKNLIGSWNVSSVNLKQMTEGKFEIADLYGKQANLAGDIDPKYLRETATFKAITGGDLINAQWKNKDPFNFVCRATPLFSSNELWRSNDNTEGYHRRWVHIPMDRRVSHQGRFDETELLAELPGILVKAIDASRRLMRSEEFTESVETKIVSDDFREQSDLVSIWLHNDDAILSAEVGIQVGETWRKRDSIYRRFKRWADEGGHGMMSQTKFYVHLERLGYVARRRADGRGFFGLVLNTDDDGYERGRSFGKALGLVAGDE